MQEVDSSQNQTVKSQTGKWFYIAMVVLGVVALLWLLTSGGSSKKNETDLSSSAQQPSAGDYSEGIDLGQSESGFSQNQVGGNLQQGGQGLQGTGGQLQSPASRDDPAVQSLLQDDSSTGNASSQDCKDDPRLERPSYCIETPPPIQ